MVIVAALFARSHVLLRSHPSLLQRRRGWAAPSRPAWATPMSFPWRRCALYLLAVTAPLEACGDCLLWMTVHAVVMPLPCDCRLLHWLATSACTACCSLACPPFLLQAQSMYKSDMTAGHVRVGKRGVCLPPEAMEAVSGGLECCQSVRCSG